MNYRISVVIETFFRFFPVPCRTGLVKIGNPNRKSPIFLTGNYDLTVRKVKRALQGIDCYLLVANSKGINVWCAATGGHLTNHEVISILKTSGIEGLTDMKTVVLPQLAATGVEAVVIKKKTGWNVVWGPVYAEDIPEFVENGMEKTPEMKEVRYPLGQRIELASAWAFPISLILGIAAGLFWREAVLPVVFLVWGTSLGVNVSFPVYYSWLRRMVSFSEFGRGGFQLVVWGVLMAGLLSYCAISRAWEDVFWWSIILLLIAVVVSIDVMGNSPICKSSLSEDRLLKIFLDTKRCRGLGFCEQVCPRNCFEVVKPRGPARIREDLCVQCGACIVQCVLDALWFESPEHEVILPDSVRKFKLNLMGKRLVKVENELSW
jgi:ferredoxin